ncbi:MAG: hypothetical protein PF440_01225 [Thiomicrorhabdus sp.]|nr:hypothetical protein [Thiomicrorhabdus sp.]
MATTNIQVVTARIGGGNDYRDLTEIFIDGVLTISIDYSDRRCGADAVDTFIKVMCTEHKESCKVSLLEEWAYQNTLREYDK